MPRSLASLACALTAALAAEGARAELEFESRGEVGAESRVFWPDDDERTDAGNFAVVSRLELDAEADWLDETGARVRVFSRLDAADDERRLIVPEELFLRAELEPLELRAGYQMFNWTATEAFHPADVVNSRILDGSFENPEKLGELTVSLRVSIPNGHLDVYAFPRFTAPVLPSSRSPLGLAGPGVELGDPLVLDAGRELDEERWQPQGAVKLQQTLGDVDVALHLLRQIDRSSPLVFFDPATFTLRPVYQSVVQLGGTYSHVIDQTLLKLEAAYRRFARPSSGATRLGPVPRRDHVLAAAGVEQVAGLGGGTETSFLVEGQLLIPTQSDFPELLEPLFQHDVLLGARHAFNDEQSTALLATAVIDVTEPDQVIANIALSRRLGEVWGVDAGARLFFYPPEDPDQPVLYEHLHHQHHLYLNAKRYF